MKADDIFLLEPDTGSFLDKDRVTVDITGSLRLFLGIPFNDFLQFLA